MKKIILYTANCIFIIILLFTCLNANAQSPVFQWAKTMLGPQNGQCIAVDTLGSVYTVAGFTGTADFDPGPGIFNLTSNINGSAFISKLDASGNFVWAKKFGAGTGTIFGDASGISIKIDNWGNIYCYGNFQGTVDFDPSIVGVSSLTSFGSGDIFILKLDPFGNFLWVKQIGGISGETSRSMYVDNSGNVYTTGLFGAIADFDPGPNIFNLSSSGGFAFISKLDSGGNFVWARNLGGDSWSISVDASGNVFTTGVFGGTSDFDPGIGTFYMTGNGFWNIFILKLNSLGNFVWAKNIGGSYNDSGWSITTDAYGNVYTTGRFSDTVDFDPNAGVYYLNCSSSTVSMFILKLDSSGNFVWANNIGGGSLLNSYGACLTLDTLGNLYATGSFGGIGDFDPGVGILNLNSISGTMFISKFDALGNLIWAKNMGGLPRSMAVNAVGNIYATGNFSGTQDFDFSSGVLNLTAGGLGSIFILKLSQCSPTYSSFNDTSCNSYTWNGQIYSSSGSYAQAQLNSNGCDSIVTLNLIVNGSNIVSSQNACDSYIYNGQTYTTSGVYASTYTNSAGCDSILTLNLIINTSSSLSLTQNACDSYIYNGQSYTTSGVYTSTYTNSAGCDSSFTLNLAINANTSSTLTQNACDSYTYNGQTYTTSGMYSSTYINATGCDSTFTLNLTINASNSSSLSQNACDNYTYNGQVYTTTGMYSSTYMNATGCDSTFTLNLTINSVNNGVTQSAATLTANEIGATYQWINCKDSLDIFGASNQSYTPTANGSYAVIVSLNGCTDTSACYPVTTIGIDDYDVSNLIQISPNPNQGVFTIEFLQATANSNISVYNTLGQLVYYSKCNFIPSELTIDISDKAKGIYFVEIIDGEKTFRKKLVKN